MLRSREYVCQSSSSKNASKQSMHLLCVGSVVLNLGLRETRSIHPLISITRAVYIAHDFLAKWLNLNRAYEANVAIMCIPGSSETKYTQVLTAAISLTSHQMKCTLSEIKCASFEGYKVQLKISPEDVVQCDDEAYVRLRPNNSSLVRIVVEGNDQAPQPIPERFSMTSCKGFKTIMELRNAAQAKEMEPDAACSLFDDDEEPCAKKKKAKRCSKTTADIQQQRDQLSSMSLEIEVDGETKHIQVLRPVLPRDGIFVRYDKAVLGDVIKLLRGSGFYEEQKHQYKTEHGDLPQDVKGIWARNIDDEKSWIVAYKNAEGKEKFKKFTDLDAAVVWKAANVNEDEGADVNPEHEGEDVPTEAVASPLA